MTDSMVVWVGAAVVVFWAVGAHNRLVRLRSRVVTSFSQLARIFGQTIEMLKAHSQQGFMEQEAVESAGTSHTGHQIAWQGFFAAVDQFSVALKAAQLQPLDKLTLGALATAHATLVLSWDRLGTCLPEAGASALAEGLRSQWEHFIIQAEMAQSEFNRQVCAYNEAIAQFPALILAWIFDFKPAQILA